MNTDTLDELAALGTEPGQPNTSVRAVTDLVQNNPIPAALTAAAVGAGLMALVALMARRDPAPLASTIPLVAPRGLDYDALKQQIADLADRVTRAVPVDAAKDRLNGASDALADGWSTVRDSALDLIDRLEPRASAAVQVARENPIWAALVVGAVGALIGSQMLGGKSSASAEPQSDPSADA